jgi:hypothetical protein
MTIDTRRGSRRYGTYTSGANALRLFDDDLDDVDGGEFEYRSRSTTQDARTTRRVAARTPPPRRAPVARPRRGRTPWVSDVTRAAPALRLPRAPFALFMAAIVVAGIVGVLVLNTKINENSFRLGDLRETQAALSLQEQQLEQQLADLESPGNLRAAATRLGLVPAGTPAYISLPDGRVVGVPQPAAGAQTAGR